MAQYVDKTKIEEILRNLWKEDDGHNPEHRICYNKALQEVQCELDTIKVKEVDLEEEVTNQIRLLNGVHTLYDGKQWWKGTYNELSYFAKHFFELGLKAQKGE